MFETFRSFLASLRVKESYLLECLACLGRNMSVTMRPEFSTGKMIAEAVKAEE